MIAVTKLERSYGNETVLKGLDFKVSAGEFVTLVGPNGCGKSTLFRIIAGLDKPCRGGVFYRGFQQPQIGYVFQRYRESLLPWLSVKGNILLPVKRGKQNKREAELRLQQALEVIDFSLPIDALPHELSGGQAQIVCILRALIREPEILLLDEPFSALDFQVRNRLRENLSRLLETFRVTVLAVSHDLDDAVLLSDRVLVLTEKPARVAKEITVPWPRPRDNSLMASAEFLEIRNQIAMEILPELKDPPVFGLRQNKVLRN